MDELIRLFQDGGPFMWAIFGTGVIAMSVTIERSYYLFFRASVNHEFFMAQVQNLIRDDSIDRAIKLCASEPNAVVPRVVKAGLLAADRAEVDIERAIEEATMEVSPLVARRTPYLNMLANTATLLGLLGTVHGMTQSFDAVSRASAETKSMLLAKGISVTMYTTAGGLSVAIPTLFVMGFLQARSVRLLDDIDLYALKTLNLLVARRKALSGEAPASSANHSS